MQGESRYNVLTKRNNVLPWLQIGEVGAKKFSTVLWKTDVKKLS